MKKIMFVCYGNICRSPMAELIFRSLVSEAGLEDKYECASSGTSTEELGNPIYPPARLELSKHGINPQGKTAVQLKGTDLEKYDLFIGMDSGNIYDMKHILGRGAEGRIYKMMSFVGSDADVLDPWYCGGFDKTYSDCYAAAQALLKKLEAGEL